MRALARKKGGLHVRPGSSVDLVSRAELWRDLTEWLLGAGSGQTGKVMIDLYLKRLLRL